MVGVMVIFMVGGIGTAVSSRQWATDAHGHYLSIAHSIGAASVSIYPLPIFW